MDKVLLNKALSLLSQSRQYMDDTHGYDSEIYESIGEFLEKVQVVKEKAKEKAKDGN